MAGELFSQQFGQGSVDSMEDLVARNIQEVLQAAHLHEDAPVSQTQSRQPSTSGRMTQQLRRHSSTGRPAAGPAQPGPTARHTAAGPAAAAHADTAGAGAAGNSSSMLDVPGHAEATIRLHKARIRTLEEENSRLIKNLAERDKLLAESQRDVKVLKAEQAAWTKEKKALEAQVERLQRKLSEAEGALAARDSAVKESSKESSRLDKERRAAEAESRARDVRLQRALEEVDRYRALLEDVRSQEREVKDVAKADFARLVADNKRLERQRAELLVAFKKQLRLIDVLKRQRVHLEAARALQFSEAEFMQMLEIGSNS